MNNRNIIEERATYTKRAQDYTELIKKFTSTELSDVGNYRILTEIGSGAFGKIYLGYHKFLRSKVCLKKGDRHQSYSSGNDNLMREFYYLREFNRHPYITKLYEVIFTEQSVYMILEYYPSGDLFEYVTKKGRLGMDEALRMFTQLVSAVYYLHKSGCCHRDLKLENILLDKYYNVKLSDFGFTREVPYTQHGSKSLLNEFCGTSAYMAPELIQRKPYMGTKTDIWALGVILYTMLTGEMPFDDSLDVENLELAVVQNVPTFLQDDSPGFIDDSKGEVKSLVIKLLTKDPDDRINNLEDVLKLPVLEAYGGLVQVEIVNKLHYNGDNILTLSSSEKQLFKDLVKCGIDKEYLKRAITEESLDSVHGFWQLLKDKNERKSKRKVSKSRGMLRLSTSKSFIGNARQAFSPAPSPVLNANNINNINSVAIERTGSLRSLKKAFLGDNPNEKEDKGLGIVPNTVEEEKKPTIIKDDQSSVTSASTDKKRHRFSLFNIFKSKHNENHKNGNVLRGSMDTNESFLHRILTNNSTHTNGTKTTKQSKKEITNEKVLNMTDNKENKPKEDKFSSEKEGSLKPASQLPSAIPNPPTTPDPLKIKRSKPTRPGSVISSYSMQTTISETSNGSGYITGYSTDNNGNSNTAQNSLYNAVQTTPQNKTTFTRGISEWSTNSKNFSSQAESPNSSFTALSRTNSIDSSSRSLSGRGRNKKSSMSSGFLLRRGKSPLNSKMNTKWTFNNSKNNAKKKKFTARPKTKQEQQQIIEEEESSGDDDEQERHSYEGDINNLHNPVQFAPLISISQGDRDQDDTDIEDLESTDGESDVDVTKNLVNAFHPSPTAPASRGMVKNLEALLKDQS